ncbi:MAG: RHS repeat-associated core domain-containing protein [Pyrinomonadaceae bacterium]
MTTSSRADAGAWFNYTFLTQKERDIETGLDYFGARYYGSSQGRFTSADPLMASAHVANPQTWNRYTYALNNPLKYVDPDGMKPVFRDYKDLTEDERRILDNSKITFGKGDKAKTLSGEALYNHMKQNEQKQLAGFLNMAAGLASITFKDGSRAIDYVKGVTGGSRERIYANVDPGLKTQMETLSGKSHEAGQRFIGPSGQAVEHANAGINYDVTFRQNIPDGPMQLSFASKENFARMDMDMDEHCQNCGDNSAEAAHIADGFKHRFTGGTNPEYIHKVLTQRNIKPSYDVIK